MGKDRRCLWALALLLCAGLAAVSGTYAWLSKEQPADGIYTTLSDFEVEGVLTFSDTAYEGTEVLIPVSFEPTAPNYIGGLKYVVRYTGASPAYIRVRMLEQWIDTSANEIMPVNYLPYAISQEAVSIVPSTDSTAPSIPAASGEDGVLAQSGTWVDHRAKDYCYYYTVPVQPKDLPVTKAGETVRAIQDGCVELTLIDQTKADNDALVAGIDPDTTQLTLILQVEAVQPNRIREFWGIDRIPQG